MNYDIYITGYIGCEIDSNYVLYRLNELKDQEQINVLVSSFGGSIADALTIYSAFQEHGNVNCHFRGMSASAATVIAMGAKHITMDSAALILVHRASQLVAECDYLNSDNIAALITELQHTQANLQKVDEVITAIYSRRSRRPADELLQLMQQEQWLNANDAMKLNLIDEITNRQEDNVHNRFSAAVLQDIAAVGLPNPYNNNSNFLTRLFNYIKTPTMNQILNLPALAKAMNRQSDEIQIRDDGTAYITAAEAVNFDRYITALDEIQKELDKAKQQIDELTKQLQEANTTPAEEPVNVISNKASEAINEQDNNPLAAYLNARQNAINMFNR